MFTDRELDIMSVLWEQGPSTASEVRERLPADLAYNTVLTMLRILEAKGHVAHTEEGRAHRFRPLVSRESAGASALSRVVEKIYSGSAALLVAQLVNSRELNAREIARLRKLLDERKRGRR